MKAKRFVIAALAAALVILGALVLLGVAIGVFVTGILKLVYLYRTANIFRNYTAA